MALQSPHPKHKRLLSTPKLPKKTRPLEDLPDEWEEVVQDDPVGERIAQLLNEGKVAHFGYPKHAVAAANNEIHDHERFRSPILSMRNYRAFKRLLSNLFEFQESTPNNHVLHCESIWFLIETFAAVYITIYSLNDVCMRGTMEFIFYLLFGMISTIIDVQQLQYAALLLFHQTPHLFQKIVIKCICTVSSTCTTFESSLCYGQRFQNRQQLGWIEKERITKFRRKHLRIMKLNTERRMNRRSRRKSRIERRKKERRGIQLDEYDCNKMEEELLVKKKLDEAVDELRRRPPTYFPNQLHFMTNETGDMTRMHLASLEYCHEMIFRSSASGADVMKKPVSITVNRRMESSALSPRESVEVADEFPDIRINNVVENCEEEHSHSDDVSSSASTYSLPSKYDFEEEEDYDYDSNESDHSSDDDDYSDADEDELSQVSYASDDPVKKMDWITVGAKIGTKILKSRQVHRVIANPSRKLLPDEAKKLIDGMNIDISEDRLESSLGASTFESQYSKTSIEVDASTVDTKSTTKSAEATVPKPPVHGMWTSAGSAAKSSSQYGGVTLPYSEELTPKTGDRKVYVSPAQESVELMRESSDGQNVDRVESDTNGFATSPRQSINRPYNLRLVNSMPTNGSFTSTNNATPKASNQALRSPLINPSHSTVPINPSESITRLAPMEKGVKIVVPMFAPNVNTSSNKPCFFQMGTVISSSRITVGTEKFLSTSRKQKWSLVGGQQKDETNCLAIKLVLDKAILRGSKFAEMNIRIMDEYNWVPRFSKFPIGSCVATTFGIGVLVGWRVEDDMHIIRSLWNRSGPGSGLAFLRRNCLHSVVEAAVGFDVETRLGSGVVEGYVRGGKENTDGKYFVHLKSKGRYQDRVIEFKRNQILSCRMAKFIPVTEHIRAAALYQLEILHYKARVREHMLNDLAASNERQKASLSKAIAEDPDFDRELDKFISHIINVLDDSSGNDTNDDVSVASESVSALTNVTEADQMSVATDLSLQWHVNMQEMFASFFAVEAHAPVKSGHDNALVLSQVQKVKEAHDSLSIILRVLLRTVAVARASVPDRPKLHIALAMIHEGLLFLRQVIRVNKNNISKPLIEAWFRTMNEISKTFGPLKQRAQALGKKIAKKMKKHSDVAKKRVLSFVDTILGDNILLHALERGDWKQVLLRIEHALVKANITDEATCEQLHKGAILLYKNLAPRKKDVASKAAAKRTQAKALRFAKFMKVVASPGRSFLRLLAADDVLELFGRVLLRIFQHDSEASMMINIYAFNFQSLRYLRTLNNMAVSSKLWATILDAIDDELSFTLSEIPEQTKYFVEPFIKLFSLGVAKFHRIQAGDSNADWLDFLLDEDSVKIIQELDMKLIDCLDAFCKDVKQLFEVMPYIKTFDNDILDLMDELDFDLMFKEITSSICDPEKFTAYMTERIVILVERFLDYLPRMSIPIEKRDLQDGWVLTCRGSDGGDLRLSDINVKRENLLCRVLGSDNVFQPLGEDNLNYIGSPKRAFPDSSFSMHDSDEVSDDGCVLDEARDMIISAQAHGCWVPGFGGLREPLFYPGVPSQLQDLPLSESLKTAIDLWQSSAICDFEFLQIVIREVSSNIELHSGEENPIGTDEALSATSPFSISFKPFNPRVDATALLLEMKNLTLHLDEFIFRVEKADKKIFDPVFEGSGSLTVKNVCISLRVEVKKDHLKKAGRRSERPLFQLATFEISLEKLSISFRDTGADWVLNTVLKGFRDQITQVVQDNVKDQIKKQVHIALEHVNGMFEGNPDLLLNMLGITLDDLELIKTNDVIL